MRIHTRWVVPFAVTGLVIGGGVAATAATDPSPDLPERTAEDLLLAIGGAEPTPFSGTVRTDSDLGLPALDGLTGGSPHGASDPTSAITRLLSGENELRVWVGGPDQQRVSLLDDFSELDISRDGDVAWAYSSSDNTATRYDLAAKRAALQEAHGDHEPSETLPDSPYTDLTPDELARTLLADADATSEVTVADTQVVAGRDAYTLAVTPRDDQTLIGTIEVAVDAATGLVLQVEVGARGQVDPAFVTGFTSLDLTAPDADVFAFVPAPGTTVVDAEATESDADQEPMTDGPDPVVHGEAWSSVVELTLPDPAMDSAEEPPTGEDDIDPQAMLEQLTTPVEGGRVLSSALLTVLITDDGRVLFGPVDAGTLLSYAG